MAAIADDAPPVVDDLGPDRPRGPRRDGLRSSPMRRWILLALGVGFVLRVLFAVCDNVPSTDETVYLRTGINFWQGEGFTRDGRAELHFPPLVPVLLGALARVLPDPHLATVLVTLVAGTLVILPLAAMAHRLRGPPAGAATAWLAALAPGLLVEIPARGGGSEAIYLLLVVLGIYASVRLLEPVAQGPTADRSGPGRDRVVLSTRRSLPWAVLSGVMFGLAFLARPEGLWIGIAVSAVVLLAALDGGAGVWRDLRGAWRRVPVALVVAGAVVVPMAAFVYPYTGYLEQHTGSRSLSAKTQDASIAAWRAVAEGNRERRDAELYRLDESGTQFVADRLSLVRLAREDPRGYAGILGVNARSVVTTFSTLTRSSAPFPSWRLVPLPIVLAALWAAWRSRRDRRVVLLAAAAVMPLLTALAFFFLARYVVVTVAVVTVFGGLAWAELLEHRPQWRRPVLLASAALIVWSGVGQCWGERGPFQLKEPVEQRVAGEWINANTPRNETIMTRSQVVAFYADRPTVAMPYDSYDRIFAFARHYGTGILVADEYIVARWRPQLQSLFGPGPWKDITLVNEIAGEGRVVRLFDVGAESDEFDGELPTLAHAGDGSPRRDGG